MYAGVVDHHIDAPKPVHDCCDHTVHLVRLAHIASVGVGTDTELAQFQQADAERGRIDASTTAMLAPACPIARAHPKPMPLIPPDTTAV